MSQTPSELSELLKCSRGGLTQSEVAVEAGIQPAMLSKAESGSSIPENRTLARIAAAIVSLHKNSDPNASSDPQLLHQRFAKAAERSRMRKQEVRILIPPLYTAAPIFILAAEFTGPFILRVGCYAKGIEVPGSGQMDFQPVWQSSLVHPYLPAKHRAFTDRVLAGMFRSGVADWIAVEDSEELRSCSNALRLGRLEWSGPGGNQVLQLYGARLNTRPHIPSAWREGLVRLLEQIALNCQLAAENDVTLWHRISQCINDTAARPAPGTTCRFSLDSGSLRFLL